MKRLSVHGQKGIIMGNQKRVNTDNMFLFFFPPTDAFGLNMRSPVLAAKLGSNPNSKEQSHCRE